MSTPYNCNQLTTVTTRNQKHVCLLVCFIFTSLKGLLVCHEKWAPVTYSVRHQKLSLTQEAQLGLPVRHPIWAERQRREAKHWEHPKMYPLELHPSPMDPPARPCQPKAGFVLVMMMFMSWWLTVGLINMMLMMMNECVNMLVKMVIMIMFILIMMMLMSLVRSTACFGFSELFQWRQSWDAG